MTDQGGIYLGWYSNNSQERATRQTLVDFCSGDDSTNDKFRIVTIHPPRNFQNYLIENNTTLFGTGLRTFR